LLEIVIAALQTLPSGVPIFCFLLFLYRLCLGFPPIQKTLPNWNELQRGRWLNIIESVPIKNRQKEPVTSYLEKFYYIYNSISWASTCLQERSNAVKQQTWVCVIFFFTWIACQGHLKPVSLILTLDTIGYYTLLMVMFLKAPRSLESFDRFHTTQETFSLTCSIID
jgi:hypothetical protein